MTAVVVANVVPAAAHGYHCHHFYYCHDGRRCVAIPAVPEARPRQRGGRGHSREKQSFSLVRSRITG